MAETVSKVYLLPEYLTRETPSQKDNIPESVEKAHRIFGCDLICDAGLTLKLSRSIVNTAQNLLHRFFYRKSLLKFDAFTVAMGCTLLASKIEEDHKNLRDIILTFHTIYQRRRKFRSNPLEIGGIQYQKWKNELITIERFILKELGFSFYHILTHPHDVLIYSALKLNVSIETPFVKDAWTFLSHAMRLGLCVKLPNEVLVTASLFFSNDSLMEATMHEQMKKLGLTVDEMSSIFVEVDLVSKSPEVEWIEPLCPAEHITTEEIPIASRKSRFQAPDDANFTLSAQDKRRDIETEFVILDVTRKRELPKEIHQSDQQLPVIHHMRERLERSRSREDGEGRRDRRERRERSRSNDDTEGRDKKERNRHREGEERWERRERNRSRDRGDDARRTRRGRS